MNLTQETLKSILTYNPDTGQFFMRDKISQDNPTGLIKFKESSRVKMIYLLGGGITAARAAWLYTYGQLPPIGKVVSFQNKDTTDFRLNNLISVDRRILKIMSVTKIGQYKKGVFFNSKKLDKKYGSSIRINKKDICLGFFHTEDEAHKAYRKAITEYKEYQTITVYKEDGTTKVHLKE